MSVTVDQLVLLLAAQRETLVSMLAVLEAHIAQTDALLRIATPQEKRPACPHCSSEDLADASTLGFPGDRVCKGCALAFTLETTE